MRWHDVGGDPVGAHLVCLEIGASAGVSARVERAAALGSRVLVLAEGCDGWTIGDRCRVAVQGGAALLDCAQPSFAGRAAELLACWQRELDEHARAERTDAQLRCTLGIVGHSPSLMHAWSSLRRAAVLSELPVLIVGETGTGKELMARAVHRLDRRRCDGPWVAVNCAAIAPALAEAELFGAERGAYTGAHRDRRGLIRAADGGILFLDEVGELSEDLQAKLLRVLQERRVRALGADREQCVDVRIVAATHRDLGALVRAGRFREDLYYRLAVLPVELPPLRARREDIGALVEHLLSRQAAAARTSRRATPALLEALAQCELPGNVRQLDNLLCQAIVAAGEATALELAHLPASLLRGLGAPASASTPAEHTPAVPTPAEPVPAAPTSCASDLQQLFAASDWKLGDFAARCERELLAAALARASGNQAAMARMLGVTPRCIYTKLRKHLLA